MRRVGVAGALALSCIASVAAATPRCPDRTGDGACTVMVVGDEKQQPLIARLATDLTDANTICDMTRTGATSAELRALVESITAPGAQRLRCTTHGGTLVRGSERRADIIFLDIGTVADFVRTQYAPRVGRCWPSEDPCRVDVRYGPFDAYPAGNRRCVDGPDFGADCTSTPCTGDPAPADPIASWCQPHVFGAADTGVTVVNCPTGLCRARADVADVQANVRRMVEVIQTAGAVPILVISYPPAAWREVGGCSRTPAPVTPLPSGTPIPDPTYNAAWEAAYCDLQSLAVWAHTFACPTDSCQTTGGDSWGFSGGPLGWLDLDRLVRQATSGRPWRVLADQRLAYAGPSARCSCLVDADCGAGGTCADASYCAAGDAATCSTDAQCDGNSQAHPGLAWCYDDVAGLFVDAYRGCLAGDSPTSTERPAWDCDAPRVPANPGWTTNTPTRTETRTLTRTPTATATRTVTVTGSPPATGTPTLTPTASGGSPPPTNTRPASVPALSSSCVGANSANPVAADKVATGYGRGLFDWAGHIGATRSTSNFGYAPGGGADPSLGALQPGTNPGGPDAGIPNVVHCRDLTSDCSGEVEQDLAHLGGYKWLYQGVCNMQDAASIWTWLDSPLQTLSNALFGLPLACDVNKYFPPSCTGTSTPNCQAWEFARCLHESFLHPAITEALTFARAYGRCALDTTRPCSSDADCAAIGVGGVCNNQANGAYPTGFLSNNCISEVWYSLGRTLSAQIIPDGCLTGATSCLRQYKAPYKDWDTATMRTYCGAPGATFALADSEPPTCPGARGDAPSGGALLDCFTYFDWTRAATRRALPMIYASRQQFYDGQPAPWEPW